MVPSVLLSASCPLWQQILDPDSDLSLRGWCTYGEKHLDAAGVSDLLIPLVAGADDPAERRRRLGALYGEFALVLVGPDRTLAVVDALRRFPLFYSTTERGVVVADTVSALARDGKPSLDEENAAEFLLTGYVTGANTLLTGISQLRPGEHLVVDHASGLVTTDRHFVFNFRRSTLPPPRTEMVESLDQVMTAVFKRMLDSIGTRPIAVPLSGGLDSRCVVAMLHRLGVRSVFCFSYGLPGNRESEISRRVAAALGYQWEFVEYTPEKWDSLYRSGQVERIADYCGNAVSAPHLQDVLAMHELDRQGVLPADAVLMPGHTIFSPDKHPRIGSTIPGDSVAAQFDEYMLGFHYDLWNWDDPDLRSLFLLHIHEAIDGIRVQDQTTFEEGMYRFEYAEYQSKFLVNSVRTYEFFGREWRLPLLDRELILYVHSLPTACRIERRLFKAFLTQNLFTGTRRPLARIEATTPLDLPLHLLYLQRNRLRILYSHLFARQTYTRWDAPLLDVYREQEEAMFASLGSSHPSLAALIRGGYTGSGINAFAALDYLLHIIEGIDAETRPSVSDCAIEI